MTFGREKMIERFIGEIGLLGLLGLYQLVPSLIVSLPIWICGRRRTTWLWSDYGTAVLPFVTWATLLIWDASNKSLANLGEALWLGCVVPVSAIIRVIAGKRANEWLLSIALLVILCLIAAGLWRFTPSLPE